MLGTALLLQIAELLSWFGLYKYVKAQTENQLLMYGKRQPTKIPFVDSQLRKLFGHPTKTTATVAQKVVLVARKVVNTQAFEHIVVGMANSNSPLRLKLRRKSKTLIVL